MSDSDDDDVLAAEYVLGTLEPEERVEAQRRFIAETPFRRAVLDWEDRLSPLFGLYAEVAPPPHVRSSLAARLDRLGPAVGADDMASNVLVLKQNLRRWRLVATGAMALAAALAVWIVAAPQPGRSGRFVAVLQKDANSPAILLDVDVAGRKAEIRQISTSAPSDRSYQLWLINPEVGGPRSLGVLRAGGVTDASLTPFDAAVIARSTYAITDEPLGGSPSGSPSGPPILSGKLVSETP